MMVLVGIFALLEHGANRVPIRQMIVLPVQPDIIVAMVLKPRALLVNIAQRARHIGMIAHIVHLEHGVMLGQRVLYQIVMCVQPDMLVMDMVIKTNAVQDTIVQRVHRQLMHIAVQLETIVLLVPGRPRLVQMGHIILIVANNL